MFKVTIAVMLALGTSASAPAYGQPSADLVTRVEDELLSDGLSLARLGQRLELHARGAVIEVALVERENGKVIVVRSIDTLPVEPAAAAAQLTVVVTAMLRERGVVPSSPGAGWDKTFTAAKVITYHRTASLAVIAVSAAGRTGNAAREAAQALTSAYRAAGVANIKNDIAGEDTTDDKQIVARAAALAVADVAIVRAFREGSAFRAMVTIYRGNGELVTGFSAVAGQELAQPARAEPSAQTARPADETLADELMRARSAQRTPDKDGVVRLWLPGDRAMQVLRQHLAYGRDATFSSLEIICRAPCGEIVDGSLGQRFVLGRYEIPYTGAFTLIGRTGDLTLKYKPTDRTLRNGGYALTVISVVAIVAGATVWAVNGDDHHINKVVIGLGGVGTPCGLILVRFGAPEFTLVPGRPE